MFEEAAYLKEAQQRSADWAEGRQLQHLSDEDLSKELSGCLSQEMSDLANIKTPPVFGADDPDQYENALQFTRLCLARVEHEMRSRGLLPNYAAAQVIIGG